MFRGFLSTIPPASGRARIIFRFGDLHVSWQVSSPMTTTTRPRANCVLWLCARHAQRPQFTNVWCVAPMWSVKAPRMMSCHPKICFPHIRSLARASVCIHISYIECPKSCIATWHLYVRRNYGNGNRQHTGIFVCVYVCLQKHIYVLLGLWTRDSIWQTCARDTINSQ